MKKHSCCVLIAILLLLTLTSCGNPSERVIAKDKGDFSYMGFESGYDFYFKPLVSELEHEGKTIKYDGALESYYFTDFILGTARFYFYNKELNVRQSFHSLLKVDYDGKNIEVFSTCSGETPLPLYLAGLNILCFQKTQTDFEIRDYSDNQNPRVYSLTAENILLIDSDGIYFEQSKEANEKSLMLATLDNESIVTKDILNGIEKESEISLYNTAIEVDDEVEESTPTYYSYEGILLASKPETLESKVQPLPTDTKGYLVSGSGFSHDAMDTLGEYTFVNDFFYATIWDRENPKAIFCTNDYKYIYTEIVGFSTSGSFMHRFNRESKIIEYLGSRFFEKELPSIRVASVNE